MTEYPIHPKFTLGIVHGGSLTIKLNYIENLKIFKEWWKYLFVEGGGFVFRLVSTEVIRQHMFFFTLYYYSYNLWIKKIILAFVYEILHKMAKCYTSPTFLHCIRMLGSHVLGIFLILVATPTYGMIRCISL